MAGGVWTNTEISGNPLTSASNSVQNAMRFRDEILIYTRFGEFFDPSNTTSAFVKEKKMLRSVLENNALRSDYAVNVDSTECSLETPSVETEESYV